MPNTMVLTYANTYVIMNFMDIRKIVTELLASGLTQQQLADLVPCGQSTINAFLSGKRGKRPSMHIGQRLMDLHAERVGVAAVERRKSSGRRRTDKPV